MPRGRARTRALFRLEVHRDAVDAITQMRRRRAVFENVPEMAAAAAAMHLGADHAPAAVGRALDCVRLGIVKARPAGATLEFGFRDEQLLSAAGTIERSGALFVIECATARPLSAVLAHDVILLRRQYFAPFRLAMRDGIGFRLQVSVGHAGVPYSI